MLRHIHLFRKLQAREGHLPGRLDEVGGGPAGRFGLGKGMRTNSWTELVRLGGVGMMNWTPS